MKWNTKIAVITTSYVLQGNSPILNVYRDAEGDWQFMGKESVSEADAKVVSLKQIIDMDRTIQEILNLEIGYMAYRSHVGGKWTIIKNKN